MSNDQWPAEGWSKGSAIAIRVLASIPALIAAFMLLVTIMSLATLALGVAVFCGLFVAASAWITWFAWTAPSKPRRDLQNRRNRIDRGMPGASVSTVPAPTRSESRTSSGVHVVPRDQAWVPSTTPVRPIFDVADGPRMFHTAARGGRHPMTGPYVVVDLETTGFSPKHGDRIVEIGIVKIDTSGNVTDEFSTLINPERDTGPVDIHGVTDEMVREAPRFIDIAHEVLELLSNSVVVAHNASFEERFLKAEFAVAGFDGLEFPALCTVWLGRKTIDAPNHKLDTLVKHCGVGRGGTHEALEDARMTAKLLVIMLASYNHDLKYACGPVNALSQGTTKATLVQRGRA